MSRDVLVVEDEPLIRMDAVDMLESAGITVVEFGRADDALRYTRSHTSDIAAVFTDINLPGPMDGIDLAQHVTRDSPSIAVVVTSGRYLERPAELPETVQFVKKPWLPLDVIRRMQDAVDG